MTSEKQGIAENRVSKEREKHKRAFEKIITRQRKLVEKEKEKKKPKKLLDSHEIIAIRCKYFEVFDPDKILEVLLKTGDVFAIETVIRYIELGDNFFFFDTNSKKIEMKVVHPLYKPSYIYSNSNPQLDKLGSLPTF